MRILECYNVSSFANTFDDVSFIRTEWPDIPAMYRPPTYVYKKDIPSTNYFLANLKTMEDLDFLNEGVYRMGQSAEFVMHQPVSVGGKTRR